ncbi:MAG: hypothetical protein H7Y13_16330 [Sphingobacteriaceae bacterium]|nr:hypothetical protein [Sphingobacteriaceae bacterium]
MPNKEFLIALYLINSVKNYIMKLAKKVFLLVPVLTIVFACFTASVFAVGNPVDSDLSNTAGTNSGKSHLDIYLFIVALLVICMIVPFFENRNKKAS